MLPSWTGEEGRGEEVWEEGKSAVQLGRRERYWEARVR